MDTCNFVNKNGNKCTYIALSKGKCEMHSNQVKTKKTTTLRIPPGFSDIKNETGLKLSNDLIYQRISGPVTLNYLESFNGKHGILLFGDEHFSVRNMCEVCDTSCTLLHGDEFLTQLDNLSTSLKKVSFYSEYRTDHLRSRRKHDIHDNMFNFINVADNDTKYRNIKFIGTNIRHIYRGTNPSKKSGVVCNLSLMRVLLNKITIQHPSSLYKRFNHYLEESGFTTHTFCEWISIGFEQQNYLQYFIRTFLENAYNHTLRTRKKDVLINAILKLDTPLDIAFDSLSNLLESGDFPDESFSGLLQNHDYKRLYTTLNKISTGQELSHRDNTVVVFISTFLLEITMILHDIYTSVLISNNIKANENTLSILYYGNCHIINLTKILSRTGYIIRPNLTINHSYKNEEINRCLDLRVANFFFDVENFLQR